MVLVEGQRRGGETEGGRVAKGGQPPRREGSGRWSRSRPREWQGGERGTGWQWRQSRDGQGGRGGAASGERGAGTISLPAEQHGGAVESIGPKRDGDSAGECFDRHVEWEASGGAGAVASPGRWGQLPGAIARAVGRRVLPVAAGGGRGICVLHSEQRGVGAGVGVRGGPTGRAAGDTGGVGV